MVWSREFKFRYANEIAGAFVILAFVLMVAGVFFAGRSQGWFAQRISLYLVFDTPEGAFGLQEGASVQVRNTAAGRVSMLDPTEHGHIQATLRVREQYRTFITKDATARVKRVFGVAGDAFIEIVPGAGPMVEDGDRLAVIKDEELMETAQRILAELQESLTPIFTHVDVIISNTASILTRIDEGEGLAGALISDGEMRDHVKGILTQAEGVSEELRDMVGQVSGLLENEVTAIAARTVSVQQELEQTLSESRRVVEAFQRHWLIRRYVKSDRKQLPLLAGLPAWESDGRVQAALQDKLEQARRADDAGQVVEAAYNLAVYTMATGDLAVSGALLQECLLAARRQDRVPVDVHLLHGEWYRAAGDLERARQWAEEALAAARAEGRHGRESVLQACLLLGVIALDHGDVDEAHRQQKAIQRAQRKGDDSLLTAAVHGLDARLALARGAAQDAAGYYLRQAGLLRMEEGYGPMATALMRAADLYYNTGDVGLAAGLYLRAATSLAAQGHPERSLAALKLAAGAAEAADDALLTAQIRDLETRLTP
jgi:phospholipid/cholesterol/gamma-HCH transport system substrate-binding protein